MDNQVFHVVRALCADVGTDRAKLVMSYVKDQMWTELQQLRTRPQDYKDGEAYFRDALVTDLLRKCVLPSTIDRVGAAVNTFLLCEKQCASTNVRLNRFLPDTLFIEDNRDEAVYQFITDVRKDIASLIGQLPDHLTPRFSGGATISDSGQLTTLPDKMSSAPTCYDSTRDLLPFYEESGWAKALREEHPNLANPVTVRANSFFTVPKDGLTDRGCCKEASINISFQLDVGRLLKTRLRRIGIDLKGEAFSTPLEKETLGLPSDLTVRGGQDLHRALARQASITGHMSTIDLSNASDTIARVLVKLLLPKGWFELLDSLRATHTKIKDKTYKLEKFSSMGNGFTFELETIIFACMARTIVRNTGGNPDAVRCYGDDLIVPTAASRDLLSVLRFFGFTPNVNKTFVDGPFRESCGGDFWLGVPVRAHYLKELPDEPQKWIGLANGLRRVAFADPDNSLRWEYIRTAWFRALDPIPSDIRRLRGPVQLGDIVIHDEQGTWEVTEPPSIADPSWEVCYIKAYVPVPVVLQWHYWRPTVQLYAALLGSSSRGVTPRGGVSGYKITTVACIFAS